MSEIFSFRRFGLFLRQYLFINRKKLLQGLLTLIGISILFCVLLPYLDGCYDGWSIEDPMWNNELAMFWWFLFFINISFAAFMFANLDTKLKRESVLMVPASNLEKYAVYFLVNIIGAWVIFVAAYLIGDTARVLIAPFYASDIAEIKPMSLQYFFSLGHDFDFNPDRARYEDVGFMVIASISITTILVLQSFFALASAVWPKNAFRKGALAGIGILAAGSIFSWLGNACFPIPPIHHFEGLADVFGPDTLKAALWIAVIVIMAVNYTLAYLRFSEQESIERW